MKFCLKGAAAVKFRRKRRGADRARRSQLARCLKTRFRLRFEANLSRVLADRFMFGDRPAHARCVRIVSGAASRCDCTRSRRIGRRAEYSARAVSNADRAGTRIRAGDCRAPRRDRAWFYALAVSYVEFICEVWAKLFDARREI